MGAGCTRCKLVASPEALSDEAAQLYENDLKHAIKAVRSQDKTHGGPLRPRSHAPVGVVKKASDSSEFTPVAQPWPSTRTSSGNCSLSRRSTPPRSVKLIAEHASAVKRSRLDPKSAADSRKACELHALPRQLQRFPRSGAETTDKGQSSYPYPVSVAARPKGSDAFNKQGAEQEKSNSGKENSNPTQGSQRTDWRDNMISRPGFTPSLSSVVDTTIPPCSYTDRQPQSKLWLKRYGRARAGGDVPPPPAMLRVPVMP